MCDSISRLDQRVANVVSILNQDNEWKKVPDIVLTVFIEVTSVLHEQNKAIRYLANEVLLNKTQDNESLNKAVSPFSGYVTPKSSGEKCKKKETTTFDEQSEKFKQKERSLSFFAPSPKNHGSPFENLVRQSSGGRATIPSSLKGLPKNNANQTKPETEMPGSNDQIDEEKMQKTSGKDSVKLDKQSKTTSILTAGQPKKKKHTKVRFSKKDDIFIYEIDENETRCSSDDYAEEFPTNRRSVLEIQKDITLLLESSNEWSPSFRFKRNQTDEHLDCSKLQKYTLLSKEEQIRRILEEYERISSQSDSEEATETAPFSHLVQTDKDASASNGPDKIPCSTTTQKLLHLFKCMRKGVKNDRIATEQWKNDDDTTNESVEVSPEVAALIEILAET